MPTSTLHARRFSVQEVRREGGRRVLEVSSVEHVRLQVVAGEGGGPAADEPPPPPPTADAPRTDDIMVSGAARGTAADCGRRGKLWLRNLPKGGGWMVVSGQQQRAGVV